MSGLYLDITDIFSRSTPNAFIEKKDIHVDVNFFNDKPALVEVKDRGYIEQLFTGSGITKTSLEKVRDFLISQEGKAFIQRILNSDFGFSKELVKIEKALNIKIEEHNNKSSRLYRLFYELSPVKLISKSDSS